MPIEYVTGSATQPQLFAKGKHQIIAHIVNDVGAWGGGFTGALSREFGYSPMDFYQEQLRKGNLHLGQVAFYYEHTEKLFIANLCAQEGVGQGADGRPPIRYAALDYCLGALAAFARSGGNVGIHMPRIGAGLAGGDWEVIVEIVERRLCQAGIKVRVYDLPGRPFKPISRPVRLVFDNEAGIPVFKLAINDDQPILLGQAAEVIAAIRSEVGRAQVHLDWHKYHYTTGIAGSRAPTYEALVDLLGRTI